MLLTIFVLSLTLAVASNASIVTPDPQADLNQYEQGIVDSTNAVR